MSGSICIAMRAMLNKRRIERSEDDIFGFSRARFCPAELGFIDEETTPRHSFRYSAECFCVGRPARPGGFAGRSTAFGYHRNTRDKPIGPAPWHCFGTCRNSTADVNSVC
jgi:hypothetical protein